MRHHLLTRIALVCAAGALLAPAALGQSTFDPPQYPQYVQYPDSAPPVTPPLPNGQIALAPAQIDQLLGPIALYPDPLLSLIFPASTYPQDVASAEQWLTTTPNPTEDAIAAQPWDNSIKGLVHYPTVLKMMNDQPDWTQALGAAFLNQQQDVLDSVQRLRAEAQAAQNLQTTSQEQIVSDNGAIRIEPVDPDVMYVPQYDPNLVYVNACPITFGVGFPIGLWCDDDFDWNSHFVVIGGGWISGWHHPAEWDRNPPRWDRRPNGWVANPHPWTRQANRPAPPRLTRQVVSRVGLDRPRGTPAPARGAPAARPARTTQQVGRQPAPAVSHNAFDPSSGRTDIQRAQQRALSNRTPAPRATPAPHATPAPAPRVEPAPRIAPAPRVEPAPAPRAAPAPRIEQPAPARPSGGNVFGGGSGSAARPRAPAARLRSNDTNRRL